MRRIKYKAFTIIELLVVLVIIGIFSAIAYPNVSSWIANREVEKEVYGLVAFINEKKSEVLSEKYGLVQLDIDQNTAKNLKINVAYMSMERFLQHCKNVNSAHPCRVKHSCNIKKAYHHFTTYEELTPYENKNLTWSATTLRMCITKDGSVYGNLRDENDKATGEGVDRLVLCQITNTNCKINSKDKNRYKITWNRFTNIKIYKYNEKKDDFIAQDEKI
jgi:prepilin-type N-terminal cleavage/methylation domain-containing protein|tara:strand:+ start:287 stop:943 length:657 start_codon:yes stop_codon:yes gene_type:complete